jgi:hypothetical protein
MKGIAMKKILTALALLGLGAAAHAQTFCVDFTQFCDGLEFTVSGGEVTGTWQSYDCNGTDATLTTVRPIGDGVVRAVCAAGSCQLADELSFRGLLADVNVPARGADVFGIDSNGGLVIFQVGTPVAITNGACAFGPQKQAQGVPSWAR